MRRLILFLFILIPLFIKAQISNVDIKIALLYHFGDLIVWGNETKIKQFKIGVVSENSELITEIAKLTNIKQVKSVNIVVEKVSGLNTLSNYQMVYLDPNYAIGINKIWEKITGKNVLLVTDNQENNLYTLINLIDNPTTGKVSFQINKQNFAIENFSYKPDLLLYGGSELDLKELYFETKKRLSEENDRVEAQKKQLVNQEQKINNQFSLLDKRNEEISKLNRKIENSQKVLDTLQLEVINKQIKLLDQEKYTENQTFLLHKDQKKLIGLRNEKLELQDLINKKQKELDKLQSAIKTKQKYINKQLYELEKQDAKITIQRYYLYLLILLGLAFLVIGFLIYLSYRNKKNRNAILEKNVQKRTEQLVITNKKLVEEINIRKKTEEILQISERNYKEIFNATSEAIFLHDANTGKILDVNDTFLKLFGYSKEEIPFITLETLSYSEDGFTEEFAIDLIRSITPEKPKVFEWKAKLKKQSPLWVEVSLSKTNIGGEGRVLAVVRNIDDRKKASIELKNHQEKLEELVLERTKEIQNLNQELTFQNQKLETLNVNLNLSKNELESTLVKLNETKNQLVQSEKLASLGLLTAGIAHEINNPINFISAGSQALHFYLEKLKNIMDIYAKLSTENANTILEELNSFNSLQPIELINDITKICTNIDEGVERTSKIINTLKNYSRQEYEDYTDYNLPKEVESILVILKNKYKNRIEIIENYNDISTFKCIKGKFNQVLMNLLSNAIESIEDIGKIQIFAQSIKEGKSISIQISDTGIGIEKKNLTKIFDPFYTTKEIGKGTGLGLYIAYGIIEQHHGSIKVKSEINKGTVFTLEIPLLEK